ncbi:tripartite tricarboxylate transporter TctB family protein [Paenibacillus sp. IB182496]|uniref:Tripartite tricarboxylate transporter TctB family protein n=1 Tax=Paenibacillus sabuli TaxID=2772509 RepID=A0A927BVG6_9BACL|nr:tripartite tricarboxylate transporter TctB family protein [Paenibacillus sabuli]MBD2847087.1 tripartite tricarboxylate transporter TctB family protein [Paenibacillus sabuli]
MQAQREDKRRVAVLVDCLVPGLLGAAILVLVPSQIDAFSSFLSEASTLPQLFPKMMAWCMILISAVRLVGVLLPARKPELDSDQAGTAERTVRSDSRDDIESVNTPGSRSDSEETGKGGAKNAFAWRVPLGIALLTGYVLALHTAGFLLASFLCMLGVIYLLRTVAWYKAILCAGIASLLIWYAFSQWLTIPLPSGWWG